jgi:hypothetical protein
VDVRWTFELRFKPLGGFADVVDGQFAGLRCSNECVAVNERPDVADKPELNVPPTECLFLAVDEWSMWPAGIGHWTPTDRLRARYILCSLPLMQTAYGPFTGVKLMIG